MSIEDVTIIGAGPAGLATALQLTRLGITPRVFERERSGGLLWNANRVENYPGFPGGIAGPELVRLFEDQAQHTGVHVTHDEVVDLACDSDVFRVQTRRRVYQSRVVVIASGTQPIAFPNDQLPPEAQARIGYEVYPLLEAEAQHIAIVGAGDAAFDYALNLARRNDVTILNRGDQVKCLPLLWERAGRHPRIAYRSRTRIARIASLPDGLRLDCVAPDGEVRLRAGYLIGALGREPRLGFLSADVRGRIEELAARGVLHLAGDVKNGMFRQTAIAVGDGILAAMRIYQHLKESAR